MKAGLLFCAPLLLALVAGCVISPRRIVSNNGGPSPSPTVSPGVTPSPTPFPTVTVTPTASPTPTPTPAAVMSVIVTAVPGQAMLSASQTHADGSTSPVPGSPFILAEVPQNLVALGSHLLVEGDSSVSVFDVDRETGSLTQTDFLPTPPHLRDAVVNPSDSMVYLLDQDAIFGFRVQAGRMIAIPGSPFPVSVDGPPSRLPMRLALDRSGDSLFMAFASKSGDTSKSFAVLKRAPDGSLSGFSALSDVPEEVGRVLLGLDSPICANRRMAALITLQANR